MYVTSVGIVSIDFSYPHMKIWPSMSLTNVDVDAIYSTAMELVKIALKCNPKKSSYYCLLGDLYFGNF